MKRSTNKRNLIIKVRESFKHPSLHFLFPIGLFNENSNLEIEKLKEDIEKLKKEIGSITESKRKLDLEKLELLKENNYLKHAIRKIQISLGEYRQPETNKHYTELYIVP